MEYACIFVSDNNTKRKKTMTIETTKKIIAELKAENIGANDRLIELNNELINFYEKKIKEGVITAIEKAFN